MADPVILCVDDEKSVTDTLISQLNSHFGDEYSYEAAGDVDEAWEVIEELMEEGLELKLIVSDWLMPRTKGDKFLLDVYARWPNIKLVMLSGHADEDAIKNLEQIVPHFQFIRKPWNRQELMTHITDKLAN